MDIAILDNINATLAFNGREWLTSERLLNHGIKVCPVCGKLNALETLDCVECGETILAITLKQATDAANH